MDHKQVKSGPAVSQFYSETSSLVLTSDTELHSFLSQDLFIFEAGADVETTIIKAGVLQGQTGLQSSAGPPSSLCGLCRLGPVCLGFFGSGTRGPS